MRYEKLWKVGRWTRSRGWIEQPVVIEAENATQAKRALRDRLGRKSTSGIEASLIRCFEDACRMDAHVKKGDEYLCDEHARRLDLPDSERVLEIERRLDELERRLDNGGY